MPASGAPDADRWAAPQPDTPCRTARAIGQNKRRTMTYDPEEGRPNEYNAVSGVNASQPTQKKTVRMNKMGCQMSIIDTQTERKLSE